MVPTRKHKRRNKKTLKQKKIKIALAFFGITRSLKYTIDSIKKNILEVFKKNNIDCTIFMHTYKLNVYKNPRTGESTDKIDNEEYLLLDPDFFLIEDQDLIKKELNLEAYRSKPDPWKTEYSSVDNFILAQRSKTQLVKMIADSQMNFNYIIWLRPDVLYRKPFSIAFLKLVNNTTICIPNFHLFGKYNFNDRFAITNMKTYNLYGDTFDSLLGISKKQELHSETILGGIMKSRGLKVKKINFKFSRIRINGENINKFNYLSVAFPSNSSRKVIPTGKRGIPSSDSSW